MLKLRRQVRWLSAVPALVLVHAAGAAMLLIDDRVDSQQKTEARFDVPDGCVITGLGFRAHWDNITTMHCRYHRLTPDGRLEDPVEVRVGSEPDNPCEAQISLPEGYVAVGFGAAGEPEWDVTLLRVWARPLRADGTLGGTEVFSDGFNPTRGPERYVLLEEADRALTGAGLNFSFNDINGIYARSRRIVRIDAGAESDRKPFSVRGWLVDDPESHRFEALEAAVEAHAPTRLDARIGAGGHDRPRDQQRTALRRLTALGNAAGVPVHVWAADAATVKDLLDAAPGLAGIVLDANPLPPASDLAARAREVKAAGKAFGVRASGAAADAAAIRTLPASVAVLLDDLGPETDPSAYGDRKKLYIEDLTKRADLLDVRIDSIAGKAATAHLLGIDGFVARVDSGEGSALTGARALGKQALMRLADEPLASSDTLWKSLCAAAYGEAADLVERALRRLSSVNDLVFRASGAELPFTGRRLGTVDELRARLAEDPRTVRMLAPDDRALQEAVEEKETALWLLVQSVMETDAAIEGTPTEDLKRIRSELARLENVTRLARAATESFLLVQLNVQDGAARTRERAENAMERLLETANAQRGEPLTDGLDAFVASVRSALARVDEDSPLLQTFRRVETLIEEGAHDAAARALVETMADPRFAPHLDRHHSWIVGMAGSIEPFAMAGGGLDLLRGADGQWTVVEIGGRHGISSGPGSPCIYFDVPGEPLDMGEDFTLMFEYFDDGGGSIRVHYDSDFRHERYYYPSRPLARTDSKTWKEGEIALPNSLFTNRQNLEADLRILADDAAPLIVRNVRLEGPTRP